MIAHNDQKVLWVFIDPALHNAHVFVELIDNFNGVRIIFAMYGLELGPKSNFQIRKYLLHRLVIKFIHDLGRDQSTFRVRSELVQLTIG